MPGVPTGCRPAAAHTHTRQSGGRARLARATLRCRNPNRHVLSFGREQSDACAERQRQRSKLWLVPRALS